MPVKTEFKKPAEALRSGDELLLGADPVPVGSVKVAVKWVTVTLQSGRTLSLRKGDEVAIQRDVPTEDEQAASRLEMQQETAWWNAKRAWSQFDGQRRKMAESMLGDDPSYALAWDAEKLMESEATWGWWARVLLTTGEDVDMAAAVELVKAEATAEVMRFHSSRSTSPGHNMQADAAHLAALKFVRGDV